MTDKQKEWARKFAEELISARFTCIWVNPDSMPTEAGIREIRYREGAIYGFMCAAGIEGYKIIGNPDSGGEKIQYFKADKVIMTVGF